jgi:hypothetical protein
MPEYILEFTLNAETRIGIRNSVVQLFLKELPGHGRQNLATKYTYLVETFDNIKIVIKRPTMNYGFDFTIHTNLELFSLGRDNTRPTHDEAINALLYCKENYPDEYDFVERQLIDLFNCDTLTVTNNNIGHFLDRDNVLRPIQIILLVIKWFFIEQDVHYWNYSGRNMFYKVLLDNNLINNV